MYARSQIHVAVLILAVFGIWTRSTYLKYSNCYPFYEEFSISLNVPEDSRVRRPRLHDIRNFYTILSTFSQYSPQLQYFPRAVELQLKYLLTIMKGQVSATK